MAVHEMRRPIGGVLDRRPSPLWLGGSDIEARSANIDACMHYTEVFCNFVTWSPHMPLLLVQHERPLSSSSLSYCNTTTPINILSHLTLSNSIGTRCGERWWVRGKISLT